MFYLFHHIPKCGGTSFTAFLRSIFTVHADYVGADHKKNPEVFEKYRSSPLPVSNMGRRECLVGHYNLPGIHLWERYPELSSLPHKKFAILRDPFDAADSGIRYGVQQGWLNSDMSRDARLKLLFQRVNYFSRIFGISDASQVEEVFEKYWFIAPLDRIDHAVKVLASETGRSGSPVAVLNTTDRSKMSISPDIVEAFRERADLDYSIYEAARLRFGAFAADFLK